MKPSACFGNTTDPSEVFEGEEGKNMMANFIWKITKPINHTCFGTISLQTGLSTRGSSNNINSIKRIHIPRRLIFFHQVSRIESYNILRENEAFILLHGEVVKLI